MPGAVPLPPGPASAPRQRHRPHWVTALGLRVSKAWADAQLTLGFIGDVLLALSRLLRGRSRMQGADLAWQLEQVGPHSLPIVSLTCFLVGLIVAYMGAAQLQRFGAQVYIADLVTVGVVREVAALMTGVILSGRVGAAFAAQLGSMQANEEIDALRVMGIPPMDYLVLPRLLAMMLVAPLLTAYAALLGMVAGLLVAVGIFNVQPLEYVHESLEALTLTHLAIGLLKGTVYAALVALAGCRQGLCAGRSAQAVGEATTAAVVQSLVWIVVAASALTILFHRLDL
jgi:phospholipid/cholesterol/gamma-HCH transport system permease protein